MCVNVCVCIWVCVREYECLHINRCVNVCVSVTYIYIFTYTDTHTHVRDHTLTSTHIHIHIHIFKRIQTLTFEQIHTYVVPSISFQLFLVQAFRIVIDSWKFSMLLLFILWDDWPIFRISGSNEQLQQKLEYTLLKPDCHSCWM